MPERATPTRADGPRVPEIVTFGPFRFDRRNGLLQREGTEIALAAKAQDLLLCLLEDPGSVVPKEALLERVWGDTAVTDHSLTEAVSTLRKTLGDDPKRPRFIQTVHRKGYRFIAPVGTEREVPMAATAQRRIWTRPLVAVGMVVGVVALALLVRFGSGPMSRETGAGPRLELTSDWGMEIGTMSRAPIAVSRDGMSVAYLGRVESGGVGYLYVRRLDRDGAVRIDRQGAQYQPTFSPDGDALAYFEYGFGGQDKFALKTVNADGSAQVVLAEGLSFPEGATWTSDGTIIFSMRDEPGLWGVPADGTSKPTLLTNPEPGALYRWPQALPDSNTVIVTARRFGADGLQTTEIVAVSLGTGVQQPLLSGGGRARHASDGHLIIGRDEQLLAVRFDPETLVVEGKPRVVRTDVAIRALNDYTAFDISDNGTLVYLPAVFSRPPEYQLNLVNRDGTVHSRPGVVSVTGFARVSMSPDGGRAAFVMEPGDTRDIFVYDLDRGGSATRLTSGQLTRAAIWTPEGNRVTYSVFTGTNYDLYQAHVDTRKVAPLLVSEHTKYASSWSPDGQILAYTEQHPDTNGDIWLLPMDTREPIPFLRTSAEEWGAAFSPDGNWIAYHTRESGQYEIWIRPFPEQLDQHDPSGVGYALKVTTECGGWPVWATDGEGLFFRNCTSAPVDSFWYVPVAMRPEPQPGKPELLFEGAYLGRGYGSPAFSISPEGRFLLTSRVPAEPMSPPHLRVIQNWFDELERLVPSGR